jgi:ribosomal protein S18 acetylase RimI-like enzyme
MRGTNGARSTNPWAANQDRSPALLDRDVIQIVEEPIAGLRELSDIPIRFRVESIFDVHVEDHGLGRIRLHERPLAEPYEKDYDREAGAAPSDLQDRFDVSNWGLLGAHVGGSRLGAAVLAWNTPGVDLLGGQHDVAVLWDLRVRPDARRRGVGSALFRAAERWAAARGCARLTVETQNVNAAACRFYERQGCILAGADRFAYPELPGEIQLIWQKRL